MKRTDIRNIAIIAHVDHGKTTLVDAMLKQTHVSRNIEEAGERIMDSMDLERERGITIKAKNASVTYNGVKINIVDTPGHADFGGEVERTLRMVDGVVLLVDAKEGPMPQTKFVLRKALELGHPAVVVVNKIDRPDAQIEDVTNRTFDLFVDLGANDTQLDFPIVYASGIKGTATRDMKTPGTDLKALFEAIKEKIPAPEVIEGEHLQLLVLALVADPYKGKMGIGKIQRGSIKQGMNIVGLHRDGQKSSGKATAILSFKGLEREEIQSAEAGEIVAVGGLDEIGIGDTIADAVQPEALPVVSVEEPTVQMTFGVNTSPFAGKEGKFVTSRNIRERLEKELETNVALRVHSDENSNQFLVSGRGELHLAILIETMRREGFELEVSQPQVIYKEDNGVKTEPIELLMIDVPQEFQGAVIDDIGRRKGQLQHMTTAASGEVHLVYHIPTRGLIGLKNSLLTKTKGTVIINHVFETYEPVTAGLDESFLKHGSLVAHQDGDSSSYGLDNAQQRGTLFIGSGVPVYKGMVAGQNSRDEDLVVNVCKAKELTNMRSKASDGTILLTPPKEVTLEFGLEYIGPDELVEVTPKNIRLRKRNLKVS